MASPSAAFEFTPVVQAGAEGLRAGADRRLEWIGLAIALTVHVALLVAMVPRAFEQMGDGGYQLDTIAVDVVSSASLIRAGSNSGGPIADAPIVEEAPADAPAEAAPVEPPREKASADEPPSEIALAKPEPVMEPKEKQPDPGPEREKQMTALAQPAVAIAAAVAPPPAEAQNAGLQQEYAKQVVAAITKARPKGNGRAGKVVVTFVIDPMGRAADVHVTQSSGRRALDDLVVSAVSRIDFPRPLAGLTEAQRRFLVPYEFR